MRSFEQRSTYVLIHILLGQLLFVSNANAVEIDFPTSHPAAAAFDGAIDVHAADIDGDGDIDVVGAAQLANDVAWWENTAGDGTAWTKETSTQILTVRARSSPRTLMAMAILM